MRPRMQEGRPATEVWAKWAGQVIDGLFPLGACIGTSDHSGVFLTENPARNAAKAALKLVPASPTSAERQLARWNAAARLYDPHLLRLLHAGRCQLAENPYLYLVMEYADQNLADLLVRRALTTEEAWELLLPTVDALAFLHRKHLVHGHLQPSNILVVGDTLKLSSDTIRAAQEGAGNNSRLSAYDPPESNAGTAGDIWALGVTLAESLTRVRPSRPAEPGEEPVLPRDFPPAFADAVRRCLSYEPTERPAVADLKGWMTFGSREVVDSTPPAVDVATVRESAISEAPEPAGIQGLSDGGAEPQQPAPKRRSLAFLIAGSVVILLICWAAVRVLSGPGLNPFAAVAPAPPAQPDAFAPGVVPKADGAGPKLAEAADSVEAAQATGATKRAGPSGPTEAAKTAEATEPTEAAKPSAATKRAGPSGPTEAPKTAEAPDPAGARKPAEAPGPVDGIRKLAQTASPVANTDTPAVTPIVASSVLYKEIPKVSRAARETIQEEIRVIVRVTVDSSGTVVHEVLADPGSDTYFEHLAIKAVRNWKFKEAQDQPSRQWLVDFVFSRDGTVAHTIPLRLKGRMVSR